MKSTCIAMLFLALFNTCFAQSINTDSLKMASQAQQDAKHWHFTRSLRRQLKQNLNNVSSDYFKPTPLTAKDVQLLNDSVYVHSYKYYALKRWKGMRTRGTIGIIVGSALVAATIIFLATFKVSTINFQ